MRKEFTREVAERMLIRCRRHCCVCGNFCGTKIELHHISGHDDNSENNAIPTCFDCHAEIEHYNDTHPRGRKYQPTELRELREATFRRFALIADAPSVSTSNSLYGQGFHDGATLTEKRIDTQLIWSFIAGHGDFGIEVLLMFGDDTACSVTNETLYDDSVITGFGVSQQAGHELAWRTGLNLGLWFVDGHTERLVLTRRGRLFRELVRSTGTLRSRYVSLETFWARSNWGEKREKPGAQPAELTFADGLMWQLQLEQYSTVKVSGQQDLFVLMPFQPTDKQIELKSIESGGRLEIPVAAIQAVDYDEDTGFLTLTVRREI